MPALRTRRASTKHSRDPAAHDIGTLNAERITARRLRQPQTTWTPHPRPDGHTRICNGMGRRGYGICRIYSYTAAPYTPHCRQDGSALTDSCDPCDPCVMEVRYPDSASLSLPRGLRWLGSRRSCSRVFALWIHPLLVTETLERALPGDG